jgi:putative methionine-R-sulfoxide reductase with GAF domain
MKLNSASIAPILDAVKRRSQPIEVANLILAQCCHIADVVHGSFIMVDYVKNNLWIASTAGPDWTAQELNCRLSIGEGITGTVARKATPFICNDVSKEPSYVPLFHYVKSELAVPVIVQQRVWGIINLDGIKVGCFTEEIVSAILIFADLVAFAVTMQEDLLEQQRMIEELKQFRKVISIKY